MVIGSTLGSSPGAQPLVRFSDVSKRFAGHVAVDALSLDIMPGEFFALLGPSGCGKTTLLRMLGGFETPDDGAITLEGNDIVPVPPHRRPVNMMFQNYALFPHLSVERNVAFGLRQEGLPRGEIAARVHDMLALVQIDAFARRKPHQLSGGQRQRVALARALVKRPKVFLLDEPLAALDKKLRSQTQFELKQLQRRLGLTFVIVTHDQEEAMTMADRIGVMNRGRLIQIGTPAEIYEHPNSRWVAEFIGEVNLFDGRLAEKDGAAFLVIGNGARLRIAETGGAANGQAVAVAIRPERIAIARGQPPSAGNCLEGTIAEIAYRGDMSAYDVRLDDGTPLRVARPNLRQGAAGELAVGERVFLSFDADACITLTQ